MTHVAGSSQWWILQKKEVLLCYKIGLIVIVSSNFHKEMKQNEVQNKLFFIFYLLKV